MTNNKLFIGGLPWSVTDEQLANIFSQAGTVISAKVITDRETGRSKGFGFVEMQSPEEAEAAIKSLNETEVEGRKIIVNIARPMEDRGSNNFRSGGRSFDKRSSFGDRGRNSQREKRSRGNRY